MPNSGRSSIIPHRHAAGRPERLLRASVSAFCSLTRPTRRESSQLDDLAVPLLARVGEDTLRFVASALSDSAYAPPLLVRRLADQPVDISAPLLMRSPVLTNIDLVALIGRHGLAHARAIGGRAELDERIARLVRSLGALEEAAAPKTHEEPETVEPEPDRAEETRDQLRAMMRPASASTRAGRADQRVQLRWDGDPGPYRKLRSTALMGVAAIFHTALAGALGISVDTARTITEETSPRSLMLALRALSLSQEEAFLIVRCVSTGAPADPRAIAAFLDAYDALSQHDLETAISSWKGESPLPWSGAANGQQPSALKAS